MAVTVPIDQLAAELKTRRTRLGLSLREVEIETGISAATLSRIERGSLPEVGVIEKLAKWLKVNVTAAQSDGMGVKTDEDLKRTIAVHLRANRNVSESTARAIADAFDIVMKVRLEEERRSKKG